jgi:ribonuclease HI
VALARDGSQVASDRGCIGHGVGMTNNLSEFEALIQGLTWLRDAGHRDVVVRGDSQLIVNQVNGTWACNAAHLRGLRDQARELVAAAGVRRLEWVPREKNGRADGESRRAYEEARCGAR